MLSATAETVPLADDRFAHRMKELRALMRTLSNDSSAFMREYDRFQQQLKDMEQKRADLAHGIPFPKIGTVELYTNRNPDRWRPLSIEELEAMPDAIFDLRQRLFQLRVKAQKLSGQQGIPRTGEFRGKQT